jgi:hypothetical protein
MKKYVKMFGFGILTWLVPFVISMAFYTRDGQLAIDIFLFKSIMIVIGSATGAILLVLYLRSIQRNMLMEGIVIGLVWFAINIGLDVLVLVPMSKMSMTTYWIQIGLRYLTIPIMSSALGYMAAIAHSD